MFMSIDSLILFQAIDSKEIILKMKGRSYRQKTIFMAVSRMGNNIS